MKRLVLLTIIAVIAGMVVLYLYNKDRFNLDNTFLGFSKRSVVKIEEHPQFGNYLTDGEGRTLYVFGNDGPSESSCVNECEKNWPPYFAPSDTFSEEFVNSDNPLYKRINIIQRGDKIYQYTYGDKPLYYFSKDGKPGEVNGNGVNTVWSIITGF